MIVVANADVADPIFLQKHGELTAPYFPSLKWSFRKAQNPSSQMTQAWLRSAQLNQLFLQNRRLLGRQDLLKGQAGRRGHWSNRGEALRQREPQGRKPRRKNKKLDSDEYYYLRCIQVVTCPVMSSWPCVYMRTPTWGDNCKRR